MPDTPSRFGSIEPPCSPDQLPRVWDELTILPPQKRVPFTNEMLQAQSRLGSSYHNLWQSSERGLELDRSAAHLTGWATDTTGRLRKCFMGSGTNIANDCNYGSWCEDRCLRGAAAN